MSASKEGIARARRIIKYNEDTLGLNVAAAKEKPLSYYVNASAPNMKPRKADRSPNKLQGCRVNLRQDGLI